MSPQEKVLKRYGAADADYSGNCLINSDGSVIPTAGVDHGVACEVSGTSLGAYMKDGGCRVHATITSRGASIETRYPLTDQQRHSIALIFKSLRYSPDYAILVIAGRHHVLEPIDGISLVKFRGFLRIQK